jgi:hypothetical protein
MSRAFDAKGTGHVFRILVFMLLRRILASSVVLLFALAANLAALARESGKIVWQPDSEAQLRIDGHSLKTWNVWLGEKKKNLILTLLVHRYLVIDIKEHAVYEVEPDSLKPDGPNLQTEDPSKDWKPIPAYDWAVRDVGPAELVKVRLGDYDKELEVQLPHPPDLRWAY